MVAVIITLLFGCSGQSPKAKIMDALKEDPKKAIEVAERIEDPLERTMIITELVEEFPQSTRPLCDALPSEISKERCIRLNERPHLWKPQKDHLGLIPEPVKALDGACSLDPHPTTCRTAQAQEFAKAGTSDKAMQACQVIPEARWRAECYFTISEELSATTELYAQAIKACDNSRQFAKSCWHHSVMGLAQQAELNWNDWEWHQEILGRIDDVWQLRDPVMGAELHSHFWAQSIQRHVEKQQIDTENIPVAALPHYRSSKAILAIRFSKEALQGIDQWTGIAEEHIGERKSKPRGFASEMDLWVPQEAPTGMTVISYLGNSHRLSHPDSETDWAIAVLEASARLRPLNKIMILEGLQHEKEAVRLTAERLSAMDLLAPPDKQEGRK